jgi:NTE family protein
MVEPSVTERQSASQHSIEGFLPEPKNRRTGIALCLSGGGFRAALFHLGALRRLNELGILSTVDTISSVSGGSIIAAHLADRIQSWPPTGNEVSDWEKRIAQPFRDFTKKNLRTNPLLKRLLPWNLVKSQTAVESLATRYENELTSLSLRVLPDRPRFIFYATDMAFGVNWVFEKRRVGDYQAGYISPSPDWPVARAVAASSCFPPVFSPLPLGLRPDQLSEGKAPPGPDRDALIENLHLTDGGVYDNMGLEPVWKKSEVVLVSDGGAVFDFRSDRGLFRLLRYPTIIGNQSSALRKRWLLSNFILGEIEGTYWGIGSASEDYKAEASANSDKLVENVPSGYSNSLVKDKISKVRTDLDGFSDAESAILENHGYLLAAAATQRYAPNLAQSTAPISPPHPGWMNEAQVEQALARSHERSVPGRGWLSASNRRPS